MAIWPRESLNIWLHNASAEIQWHGAAQQIAVTRSAASRSQDASYLTSLRSAWFDYAAQELGPRFLAAAGVRLLGRVAQAAGLDRVILVGNLPVSTNEHQDSETPKILEVCHTVSERNPDHFIGIRNVLPHKNANLMRELRHLNFVAIPSRVIYEFDLRLGIQKKHSHLMRDISALKKSGLQCSVLQEISNAQAGKLRDLYQSIYIDKHSALNPQYTSQFFTDMVHSQVMQCLQLHDESGVIQAFALLYKTGETLTVPALGYNRALEDRGLYRMLFAAIHQHASSAHLLLNYSSGAGDFKRKRGGTPYLEYTFIRAPMSYRQWQKKWLRWIETQTATIGTSDLIALGA
jgi:hypothetical protein